MAYTQAQLVTFYTNANAGTAPTAAQTIALTALANQNASGTLTDAQALAQTISLAANTTTAVSVDTYAFFTGVAPSQAGLAALNAAYVGTGSQVGLNGENRFIAQSVSLALGNAAAKTAFSTSYGSLSVADATAAAYNVIVGNAAAAAANINVSAAVAYLSSASSVAYYTNFVKANVPGLATGSAADLDLAVKAAIVGEIFFNATQANSNLGVGSYAAATNNLLKDLADDGNLTGNNAAGINLFGTYGTTGGTAGGTPGSSLNLTGSIDNLVGTGNDDTFNGQIITANATATLFSTLQAADTINGGAGNDTLNINILNGSGAAIGGNTALPTGFVTQGVEVINIRATGAGGDTVSAVASNFAGATSFINDRAADTLTVTAMNSGQAVGINGNGGATTVGGVVGTYQSSGSTATTTYSAVVNLTNGTGNGTTTSAGSAAVPAGPGGTPAAVPAVAGSSSTNPTVTLSAGAGAITAVTINSTGAANSVGALQLAGANTVRTLNINAGTGFTVVAPYSGTPGTTVEGTTGFGGASAGGATSTTGAINVTGAGAVSLGGIAGGADNFTTLNITTGTGTLNTGSINSNVFAAGATINVSGASATTTANTASVTLGTISSDVTTLNASGLTAGGVSATIGAGLTGGFTGGAGTDVITVSAVPGGAVNGGAGTDIIAFTDGANLTSAVTTLITNFETLRVGGTAGNVFDPTLINGITSYQVTTGTGVQINNLVANPSVTVIGNQTTSLTLNLANAGGTSDALNLRLDNLSTSGAAGVTVAGLALGGNATAGQIETLNITSAGRLSSTGAYNAVTLAASGTGPNYADANTVNLSGSVGLTLTTGNSAHAQKIDASTHTGGVSIVNTTTATGPFTIIGSGVNDTINSNQTATIYGGAGGDSITLNTGATTNVQTLVYKLASDSQLDIGSTDAAVTGTAGAFGSGTTVNAGKMDIVNGFTSGQDKIDVSAFGFGSGSLGGAILDKGTVATDAALTALLSGTGLFTDGVSQRGLVQIHGTAGMSSGVAGDFLIIDVNKDGAYSAGTDIVIKFAGTANLALGDFNI